MGKINQPLTVVVQSLSETTEPLQEMTHVFRQLWLRPELVRRLGQHLETVTEDAQEREAFVMEFLRTNPTVQAAQSQAAQEFVLAIALVVFTVLVVTTVSYMLLHHEEDAEPRHGRSALVLGAKANDQTPEKDGSVSD